MEKKILCPLRNGDCIEDGAIVNKELAACRFWVHVYGQNPQSGEKIDAHDCAIAWMPVLLIENSKEQRTTGKEVEALRNQVAETSSTQSRIMAGMISAQSQNTLPPEGYRFRQEPEPKVIGTNGD